MIDLDQWDERSATLEFDEGMTRFAAETEAASRQGVKRHEVLNAIRQRNSEQARGHGQAMERDIPDNLPGVQRATPEQDRPVLERDVPAGRDCGALPPLRMEVRRQLR